MEPVPRTYGPLPATDRAASFTVQAMHPLLFQSSLLGNCFFKGYLYNFLEDLCSLFLIFFLIHELPASFCLSVRRRPSSFTVCNGWFFFISFFGPFSPSFLHTYFFFPFLCSHRTSLKCDPAALLRWVSDEPFVSCFFF